MESNSPIKGSKVLITGHTGFKGSWLAEYLKSKDVEIFGLSLEPSENSLYTKLNQSIYAREYFQDINDHSQVLNILSEIKPNYIFHLAAQPLVLNSYKNPRETFVTNVIGTINVIDSAFKHESLKSIVIATTDKVYRNFEDGRKYREDDPLQGIDPYSASKVATEAVVRAWQTLINGNSRISLNSARAGNVIGGGDFADHRLMPDLIRSYLSKEPISIRNPRSTRPWQHVLDPIVGYVKLAEMSTTLQELSSFNFGPQGKSLSVIEVCEIVKRNLDIEINFESSDETPHHEANLLDLDSSKARQRLNWENHWSQTEAVTSTIQWWKSTLSNELSAAEACLRDIELLSGIS